MVQPQGDWEGSYWPAPWFGLVHTVPSHGTLSPPPAGSVETPPFSAGFTPAPWFGLVHTVPSHGALCPPIAGFVVTPTPFSAGLVPAPWFGLVHTVPSHGVLWLPPVGLVEVVGLGLDDVVALELDLVELGVSFVVGVSLEHAAEERVRARIPAITSRFIGAP